MIFVSLVPQHCSLNLADNTQRDSTQTNKKPEPVLLYTEQCVLSQSTAHREGHLIISASTLPQLSIQLPPLKTLSHRQHHMLFPVTATHKHLVVLQYKALTEINKCHICILFFLFFFYLSGAVSSSATPALSDTERLRSLQLPQ